MKVKKVEFGMTREQLIKIDLKLYDFVEFRGKKYIVTNLDRTSYPKVTVKKTAKSKGRPLTRAKDIVVAYNPFTEPGKKITDDQYNKIAHLLKLTLIDNKGQEWTAVLPEDQYEIVNKGQQDPWTIYVDAYRKAKEQSVRSYLWADTARKALWDAVGGKIEPIMSSVKIEKEGSDPKENVEDTIKRFLWSSNKKAVSEVVEFFKSGIKLDYDKLVPQWKKEVDERDKSIRATAKYAEKHPEQFD